MSSELVFDKKKFEENRKTICPISFIGKNGEAKKTEEVNSLFTLPYDVNIISDATVNTKIVDKEFNDTVDQDTMKSFLYSVDMMKRDNEYSAIKQYLIMNTRDAVYSFICSIREKFNDLVSSNRDDVEIYTIIPYWANINDFINSIFENMKLASSDCYVKLNEIYFFQLMNSIFYQFVTFIDNGAIKMANNYYMSDTIFKNIVYNVYGEEVDDKALQTMTSQYKYTFIAAICRDIIEAELPKFYNALHMIFLNGAHMALNVDNPIFLSDVMETALPEKR